MSLGAYLRGSIAKTWDWRSHDCCRWVAAWVVLCGHPDPMGTVEPYDNGMTAMMRIARAGGLVPLWTRGAAHAGLGRVDDARAGDIGVLHAAQEEGPSETVGIFTGERWAVLGVRGLIFARPDALAIWRP